MTVSKEKIEGLLRVVLDEVRLIKAFNREMYENYAGLISVQRLRAAKELKKLLETKEVEPGLLGFIAGRVGKEIDTVKAEIRLYGRECRPSFVQLSRTLRDIKKMCDVKLSEKDTMVPREMNGGEAEKNNKKLKNSINY